MKELKFRAWHEKLGHYLKDNEFYIGTDGSVFSAFESYDDKIINTNYIQNFSRDDFDEGYIIVEQYTGLKDKNGKEIYESDLVAYEKDNIASVRFEYVGFYPFVEPYNDFGCPSGKEVEVIGNIHENPDFLEKK